MRQKLGVAGVVVILAVVWVSGFLWMRGEQLTPASAPGAAPSPTSSPSSGASTSTSPAPIVGPTRAPMPSGRGEKPARQLVPSTPSDLLEAINQGLAPTEPSTGPSTGPLTGPSTGRPAGPPVVDTVVASFNLLGSSHTTARGNRSGYAEGPQRLVDALQILDRERVSLVGMQEVHDNQHRAFAASARGWEMHPGVGGGQAAGQNVVAWRTSEWELVEPGSIAIPYFFGNIKQMPFVLLRHRETDMTTYLSTFHNPASTSRVGNQTRWREEAMNLQVEFFNRLRKTGIPHLVTGDFNERERYFCRVTAATGFTSPAGGSNDAGCRPPPNPRIDWVFGDPEIEWTRYASLRDALVRRTTDHPVIVAGARLDARDFPSAWSAPES